MGSGSQHASERPATFREVFASREFRAIYTASTLSWVGDYLARAAITLLVYQTTNSVLASAAAFAISYAPWLIGGPLLAAAAERHAYRNVMILCDVGRMLLMAAVAVPGLPLPATLGLLLLSALLAPPFEAARSATLPAVLSGDRYVVGLAIHTTTAQPAQVAGYFLGAMIAIHQPRLALLINAATFGVSALLIWFGVRHREPALDVARRTHLLRETGDGFRLVFGSTALRAIAIVIFGAALFVVVPEGLAAAWAADIADKADRGWAQGMIMGAGPFGWILGGLLVSRLIPPAIRRKLIRAFAVGAPLVLVPALLNPPAAVVAVLAGACGFAMGGLAPVANGLFVRALPNAYRARAFGVMQSGLQLIQGFAVLFTGWLAQSYAVPAVVGWWSLMGVALMIVAGATWPRAQVFDDAAAAASADNEARASAEKAPPVPVPSASPAEARTQAAT